MRHRVDLQLYILSFCFSLLEGRDGVHYFTYVQPPCTPTNFLVLFACFTCKIITNGIYRSIEHRAIVNHDNERLSIATFYSPGEKAMVGPAPSLITEQTPARFKRIGVKEYFRGFFARKLEGKSYVDVMKIENHD